MEATGDGKQTSQPTSQVVAKKELNMITRAEARAQIQKNQDERVRAMGLGENPSIEQLMALIDAKIRKKISKANDPPTYYSIDLPPKLSKEIRQAIAVQMAQYGWEIRWSFPGRRDDGCLVLIVYMVSTRTFGKN
jgi:hypothetical protein